MPKWTDYTIKTEPADNDEVMVLDTAGKANKRLGLSTLSDWIIGKIANKVFEKLQTQNKTILGAINELNRNTLKTVNNLKFDNNFKASCTYIAREGFGNSIVIFGITSLPFVWTNYSTFGMNGLSTETTAFFKYMDENKVIDYRIDASREMICISASENKPILFYSAMKIKK